MNERLHSVLAQRDVSPESLAEVCEVDAKTVSRWLSGRVPHPRHRFRAAQHLRVEETFLWPVAKSRTGQSGAGVGIELVGTYQNRASVPRDVWLSLLQGTQEQIDVLVFSGTFFAQSNPYVAKMLTERAAAGVRVRLCFGDPRGHAAAIRGREEGIGNTLAAKIRASLTYYRALLPEAGCEVRLHDTTLYNSLFRYDDNLLVNPHIWGQPASANPLFHLKKAQSNGWFDNYAQSFDAVWAGARPWNPDQEETAAHGQD
ncbi:helix-turn-helix domain-containing protein [Streptomyces rapamycinicus]|uniref:Transcriptional regulator with XRE-family HTH domain n=1 Tax=Streptomyces rapamycinicus TaxID=1226757 RepID=A0ABR6LUF3_9ACTN|nr:helix-turn-helix domain-containing protein [Streptomyces rapamycinicus]MBB4785967.1 transcriptional regulator with XRE-family HTH domain [Streptomyces rapamycinicus]UTO66094.1 helix-turn-helix domain-containing protein [Streptomyces rapamycinicus]UTP34048.1 helix-turn-helix domain-containing protein [Streptomyces rapamycinicus NRRL 5491]